MPQRKNKKTESGDVILRDVEREMAKPRLAESVRKAAVNGDTDESSNGEEKV
jgi:hypothetical protein